MPQGAMWQVVPEGARTSARPEAPIQVGEGPGAWLRMKGGVCDAVPVKSLSKRANAARWRWARRRRRVAGAVDTVLALCGT